tara:strand:+ start:1781 stop:1963 length:183 start_codon:yes stop_codon:yes gene_type:complete
MRTVFMLSVPYEGFIEPVFTTRHECEKHWEDLLKGEEETKYGCKVFELTVYEKSEEAESR